MYGTPNGMCDITRGNVQQQRMCDTRGCTAARNVWQHEGGELLRFECDIVAEKMSRK